MISSSPPVDCGLDTMILVYSLLQGHPALPACEHLLRTQSGWFTSPWVLFEAKSVLTKEVARGPVVLIDLKPADVPAVLQLAHHHALDFTDAVLLHLARTQGARFLASEDQHLSQVCPQFGITVLSPLDAALRQAVGAWEAAHVPPKGLQRVLRRIHQWLSQSHPQAAHDFWSQTGAGNHLP